MKKLFLLALVLVSIFGCKKDSGCVQNDFVGVWNIEGNESCFSIGSTKIEIKAQSDDKLTLTYLDGTSVVESYTDLKIDDCEFEGNITQTGTGFDLVMTGVLDNGTITLKTKAKLLGLGFNACTEKLSK